MSSNPVEPNSTEGATQAPSHDEKTGKPKNRKGVGAKKRQAEKFRTAKNEDFHQKFKAQNQAIRDSWCRRDDISSMLDYMSLDKVTGSPTVEVEIQVDSAINQLAKQTTRFLTINKVESKDGDEDTIKSVLTLQVQAKVALARENSGFETGMDTRVARQIGTLFSRTLKSSVFFLDQIGRVNFGEHRVVPKLKVPVAPETRPEEGWVETGLINQNSNPTLTLYVRSTVPAAVRNDPIALMGLREDDRRWFASTIVNLSELATKHADMILRIERKLQFALHTVNFDQPNGSPAQVVASTRASMIALERDCWAMYEIPTTEFNIGAGFEFGLDSTHKAFDRDLARSTHRTQVVQYYETILKLNYKGGAGDPSAR